ANPDWQSIAVMDATGRTVASSGPPPADTPRLRAFFQQIIRSGRVNGTMIETQPGTGARVIVGVPLKFGDGSNGLLLVSPSIRVLSNELRAQAHGNQLDIALLDSNGASILSPAQDQRWIANPRVQAQ